MQNGGMVNCLDLSYRDEIFLEARWNFGQQKKGIKGACILAERTIGYSRVILSTSTSTTVLTNMFFLKAVFATLAITSVVMGAPMPTEKRQATAVVSALTSLATDLVADGESTIAFEQ